MKHFISSITPILLFLVPFYMNSAYAEQIENSQVVEAYKGFWESFQKHEEHLLEDGKIQYKASLNVINEALQSNEAVFTQEKIKTLESTMAQYKDQLTDFPDAENKPHVLLNLAQVLNLHGNLLALEDKKKSINSKKEALKILSLIEEDYPEFISLSDAYYLHAIIFESLDEQNDALKMWEKLTKISSDSIHGIYAFIAIGDYWFFKNEALKALNAYKGADKLLKTIVVPNYELERLRVAYRLAWSAYKAAELETVIKASVILLEPGDRYKSTTHRKKIYDDAIDLIGDSLYEDNNNRQTEETILREDLRPFAGAISLRTMKRYLDSNIFDKAIFVGELAVSNFQLSPQFPSIAMVLAEAYDRSALINKKISILEKAAFTLPMRSLWRSRHKGDLDLIKNMELNAKNAARSVAEYHYNVGLASGNINSFQNAMSFYDLLVEFEPSSPDSNIWRLHAANSAYFSDSLYEAAERYTDLKNYFSISENILQVASYQLVLTYEKIWRKTYTKLVSGSQDIISNPDLIKYLVLLEKSTDEFANRFPKEAHTFDLLIITAKTNTDFGQYGNAISYWQKALLLEPPPEQRTIIIRGLVQSYLRQNNYAAVIDSVSKFLNLENWPALGPELQTELKRILSEATFKEGAHLKSIGQIANGGRLMVDIAREFPDIPNRNQLFREGAYLMGLAGLWKEALSFSKEYLEEANRDYVGDMIYLRALAEENLLKFNQSANSYISLAKKYPKHVKAYPAARKAEQMALANSDYSLAAFASYLAIELSNQQPEKFESAKRSAEQAAKANEIQNAIKAARKAEGLASSKKEKFDAKLLSGKLLFKAKKDDDAVQELEKLSKELERDKKSLKPSEYAALAGETYVLLGNDIKATFDDFSVIERGGDLSKNISHKDKLFVSLSATYNKAVQSKHPQWSAEARFRIAEASESFSNEISSVLTNQEITLTKNQKARFQEMATTYSSTSKTLYGQNAVIGKQNLSKNNNEWTKRSSVRLSGKPEKEEDPRRTEVIPSSIGYDIPFQWSN